MRRVPTPPVATAVLTRKSPSAMTTGCTIVTSPAQRDSHSTAPLDGVTLVAPPALKQQDLSDAVDVRSMW